MNLKYGAYAFVDALGLGTCLGGEYWQDYIAALTCIECNLREFIVNQHLADKNAESAYIASDSFLLTHSAWRVADIPISTVTYNQSLTGEDINRVKSVKEVNWNLIRLKSLGEVISKLIEVSTIGNHNNRLPMLAMRGMITVGDGYFEANRWAGPAPIESIKHERELEAALVVTSADTTKRIDSIRETYDGNLNCDWWNHLDDSGCPRNFIKMKVPIKSPSKDVSFEERYVHNPFFGRPVADGKAIIASTISAMGANDKPDREPMGLAKRWYTQCIMDQLLAQTDVNYQRYQQ